MWRRELSRNKLYAIAIIFLGALSVPIEWDATFLLFALIMGAGLFFSKENLWNEKENKAVKWKSDFQEYLRKYCKSRNVLPEEVVTHNIVQEVKEQYEKRGDTDEAIVLRSEYAEFGCCK